MADSVKDEPWVDGGTVDFDEVGPGAKRRVLAYCDEAMITQNDFEPGAVGAPHTHPHTQLTYVASGVFRFTIGEETRQVKAGDTLVMHSGVRHGCVCVEAGTVIDFFTPMREDFVVGR